MSVMFADSYELTLASAHTGCFDKERKRQELADAVEEFLRNGGRIQQFGHGVAGPHKPPRKHITFGNSK